MKFDAVILAGGQSSRMGRDKAFIPFEGKTLLARQLALARGLGAETVFVSGRAGVDYSGFGSPVVTDQFLEAGPLAGIESALGMIASPLLLVLAVDMPGLNPQLLHVLLGCVRENSGVVSRVKGRLEALVAFYPKAAHTVAVELLQLKTQAHIGRTPGPTDFAMRCAEQQLVTFTEIAPEFTEQFQSLNEPPDLLK